MADPREEALKALEALDAGLWSVTLPATDADIGRLRALLEPIRAALRTGGQQEAVAWVVEGCIAPDGRRGVLHQPTTKADAERLARLHPDLAPRIRPLVYGDTLGDSKGEG